MGRRDLQCFGNECTHFVERYMTEIYGGGYLPKFGMTIKYCTHPDVYVRKGNSEDTGTPLQSINKCPNETNNQR
jgi:hypothetical protein